MIIYWSVCFSALCIAFFGTHSKGYIHGRKGNKFWTAILSCIPLFFLSAFRYGIGTDYFNYVEIYSLWVPRGARVSIEPLFFYLNKAVHYFAGDNYQWLFVIFSFVYLLFTFVAIYRMSDSPTMSIYLLVAMTFYLSFFNTSREHIGCSILLFSVYYAEKKDWKKFLILIAVATGFHYTCAIFLIIYLFTRYKLKPQKIIIWTLAFLALQGPIVFLLSRILASSTRYSKYLVFSSGYNINNILGVLIQIALLLFAVYLYKYNPESTKYNIFLGIQMLAVWVNILSMTVPALARIKWLFSMPSIIFLPFLLKSIPNDSARKLSAATVCIAYFVYATVMVGVLHSYGVIPYVSIFTK